MLSQDTTSSTYFADRSERFFTLVRKHEDAVIEQLQKLEHQNNEQKDNMEALQGAVDACQCGTAKDPNKDGYIEFLHGELHSLRHELQEVSEQRDERAEYDEDIGKKIRICEQLFRDELSAHQESREKLREVEDKLIVAEIANVEPVQISGQVHTEGLDQCIKLCVPLPLGRSPRFPDYSVCHQKARAARSPAAMLCRVFAIPIEAQTSTLIIMPPTHHIIDHEQPTPTKMTTSPRSSGNSLSYEDLLERYQALEEQFTQVDSENTDLRNESDEYRNTIGNQEDEIGRLRERSETEVVDALLLVQENLTSECRRLEDQALTLQAINENHEAIIQQYKDMTETLTGAAEKPGAEERDQTDDASGSTDLQTGIAEQRRANFNEDYEIALKKRIDVEALQSNQDAPQNFSSRESHDLDMPGPAHNPDLEAEHQRQAVKLARCQALLERSDDKLQHCGEQRQQLEDRLRRADDHIEHLREKFKDGGVKNAEHDCEGDCQELSARLCRLVQSISVHGQAIDDVIGEVMVGVDCSEVRYGESRPGDCGSRNKGGDGREGRRGG
ncbi:uncharacterized protein K460DRAFT_353831 [Cucurbitaria berberidis CBS 394.84]|uniref:Uncharacterized protein n=1 Tax=Cucurbitaria berberidis CBS 394.84 TaxID=1168544 RepID=A0A9P4GM36_9PLEO|nr:uncharacterized protein K460DRAFT_353831 [Cucurbitaria berberidis CBS 394.84]KAF1848898.1 hypothetical protein K460DRAFT_353831 [Cucurbitaria berberidis CBS 394.84]